MQRDNSAIDRNEPFPWTYLGLGLGYGQALWIFGFGAAGAGHGCFVLIGLAAAPISLSGSGTLAFIVPFFWWPLVAVAAARSYSGYWLGVLLVLMLTHYASLPWVLAAPSPFANWEMFPKVRSIAYQGFAIYAAGQLALCLAVMFRIARYMKPNRRHTGNHRRQLPREQGLPEPSRRRRHTGNPRERD